MSPTVSIILTSYNHAAYVAAAIDSALKQTLTDFELLIIDDGSTYSSRDIITGCIADLSGTEVAT